MPVTGPLDPLVGIAREIAGRAHAGQLDKAGRPYIGHPQRVADGVLRRDPTADGRVLAVAWLHDVLEDSDLGPADLVAAGLPLDVVAAVEALSKSDDEDAESYIGRVRAQPLAVVVKHADIDDNTGQVRVAALDEETRDRLTTKYRRYRELLEAPLSAQPH